MVKVVLVQFNLVSSQYQQRSEVLNTFIHNKFYSYLLNIELSNLVLSETYNSEFDNIIVTFMDQNSSPLEIEDKISLTLLINR